MMYKRKAMADFLVIAMVELNLTVDELDPIVFFKLDSMEIGKVSKPIAYRTDEGKDAVRILYYKARTPPTRRRWNKTGQKFRQQP